MTVRKVDIAAHLGVSRQQVNNLKNAGMPCDSIEAASAWYEARNAAMGLSPRKRVEGQAPSGEPPRTDESFAEIVAQHRSLKQRAYEKYLQDLDSGSVAEQSKSYATYDKLLKTMVNLEREAQARDLASRRLVESALATATFGKVLSSIRSEMTQMAARVAPRANPDDPRMAMKAIEVDVSRMLSRLSNAAVEAIESLTEASQDKPVETDLPEPEEPSDEAQS